VAGDPRYDPIELRLAARPPIAVPAVVIQGAEDTVAPLPVDDPGKGHFTGPYRRQIIPGVRHNVPQEAPQAFASAILSLSGMHL
jgi:pimeloyl-ACP methyl ester carboxylesterase